MSIALLAVQVSVLTLTCVVLALVLQIREEVRKLIATNEVVDKLCDAVLAAQLAQAGAEGAMAQAQADLAALAAQVELTPETQAKVEAILGNAVAADPPVTP